MDLRGDLALGMHCTVSQPASKPGRPPDRADCTSIIWSTRVKSSRTGACVLLLSPPHALNLPIAYRLPPVAAWNSGSVSRRAISFLNTDAYWLIAACMAV